MAHRPRGQILLLATLVLLCRCAIDWSPLSLAPDWRLSVEVAQVRASLGSAVATVRVRTPLSEIGHIDLAGRAR